MIIVTGGAGFIGSNIVAGLEEAGYKNIVVCDVLGNGDKWRNIAKRELCDIVNPERLFDYLNSHAEDIEAIIHMGAISATTETDADLIIENNFILSRRLWKWCALNEVRFIYASSAATYGDGAQSFDDRDDAEYLASLKPLNPYGWSKHVFDRRVSRIIYDEEVVEALPPQWAGLKFFNVYGPNEYHKGDMMSVIAKLYPQVMAGAPAKLFKSNDPKFEDGGQIRDFVYVQDCVNVVLWLLDNPKISGLFNVGTGKGRSFKDLAEGVFKAAGMNPKINYIEMPETLRDKYQNFTQANMQKLRDAGYNIPATSLEDGINDYVTKYLSASDPYR